MPLWIIKLVIEIFNLVSLSRQNIEIHQKLLYFSPDSISVSQGELQEASKWEKPQRKQIGKTFGE